MDEIDERCKGLSKLAHEKAVVEDNLRNLTYMQMIASPSPIAADHSNRATPLKPNAAVGSSNGFFSGEADQHQDRH